MRGKKLGTANQEIKHGVPLKPWYRSMQNTGSAVGKSLLLALLLSAPLAVAQDAVTQDAVVEAAAEEEGRRVDARGEGEG